MDTSETYIKMCEAASELWPLVKDREGTPFAWRSFRGFLIRVEVPEPRNDNSAYIFELAPCRRWLRDNEDMVISATDQSYPGRNPDDGTPLYRQDQLQEMLKFSSPNLDRWWDELREALDFDISGPFVHTESWEQFWLAFVMRELYSKRWNGECWI